MTSTSTPAASVFRRPGTLLVTCPKGLSGLLRSEIDALEMPVKRELVTGVELEGTLEDAMRLNLHVRTGHRVLYLVGAFTAQTPDQMFDRAFALPWEDFIPNDGYLSVVSSVDTPSIRDTQFANVRLKDAIVDRMRSRTGRRPDSGSSREGAVIFLFWKNEQCAVYLDTSGEPLSRRGYRKIPWKAPMQETLAAALVMETGWMGDGAFVNPMCGSGTLAIEAALMALGRAPGLLREAFAFRHLKGFDAAHWEAMRRRARSSGRRRIAGSIVASDISPDAVIAARKNAVMAGVDHLIEFTVCDFAATPLPDDEGVVLLNPEYGARLGDERALEHTYARIGDFFKQRCSGYTGYVFTGNMGLAKRIGLRTSRRLTFYNTTIECRLLEYELYSGSRKHRSSTEEEGHGEIESAGGV